MNKILKKIATFFLAMSLTFSMGMAAFADEPTQEELLKQYYAALAKMQGTEQGANQNAAADSSLEMVVYQKMMALKATFPEGMPYTNDTIYRSTHMKERKFVGAGCVAFATAIQDNVFDPKAKVKTERTALSNWALQHNVGSYTHVDGVWVPLANGVPYDGNDPVVRASFEKVWNTIRPGDVLNCQLHTFIVLSKDANGITIAEGNYSGKVHWGRTISKEALSRGLMWKQTMY